MSTLTVTLPEPLTEFIQSQVAEGTHPSADDYIGRLVEEDRKRKARAAVEALLLEGMNSGERILATPEYWEEKERQLDKRCAEGNNS